MDLMQLDIDNPMIIALYFYYVKVVRILFQTSDYCSGFQIPVPDFRFLFRISDSCSGLQISVPDFRFLFRTSVSSRLDELFIYDSLFSEKASLATFPRILCSALSIDLAGRPISSAICR